MSRRSLLGRLATRVAKLRRPADEASRTPAHGHPGSSGGGDDLAEVDRLLGAGDLDGALARARLGLERHPRQQRLARAAERIDGDLRVLAPGWLPTVGHRSEPATQVPGRVMHLVSTGLPVFPGGNSVRTHDVARAQLAAGLDPVVVVRPGLPEDPDEPTIDDVDGVPYRWLQPGRLPRRPQDHALEAFAELAADAADILRPAVIHSSETASMRDTTAQVAMAVARSRGIPHVFEVRGFREDSWVIRAGPDGAASQRYRLVRASDTWLMHHADAVVTLSEVMAEELAARGVAREHITVVPNAVDGERYAPRPRDAALAADLGIADHEVVIGFAGGLRSYEALPVLVRAFDRLVAASRPVRLVLVGDGPDAAMLRALVAELGLEDRVSMPGLVPFEAMVAWYSLMDIITTARTADRVARLVTPTKPLEALAMARAVVVSDTPALAEMVVPDRTAVVVQPGSIDALAEALDRLVLDEGLRARLGAAGREWVIAQRSWTTNGRRYRALFERLGAV